MESPAPVAFPSTYYISCSSSKLRSSTLGTLNTSRKHLVTTPGPFPRNDDNGPRTTGCRSRYMPRLCPIQLRSAGYTSGRRVVLSPPQWSLCVERASHSTSSSRRQLQVAAPHSLGRWSLSKPNAGLTRCFRSSSLCPWTSRARGSPDPAPALRPVSNCYAVFGG